MKWQVSNQMIDDAKELVSAGHVQNVVNYKPSTLWMAEVWDKQIHTVLLDGTAKQEDSCDCLYFKQHHFCKHTVAVELYLAAQGKQRYLTKTSRTTTTSQSNVRINQIAKNNFQVIQDYTNYADAIAQPNLQLIVDMLIGDEFYYYDNLCRLSLRIGRERFYVVKQLQKLLSSYVSYDTYQLGKYDTIDWRIDRLSASDRELLLFLSAERLIIDHGKEIFLETHQFKRFLTMLQTLHVDLNLNGKIYQRVQYNPHYYPLQCHIEEVADGLQLTIPNMQQMTVLPELEAVFCDGIFYPMPRWLQYFYEELTVAFFHEQKTAIQIPKDAISDFLTYNIPIFEQIGQVVWSDTLQDKIQKSTEKPSLFVEKVDKYIQITMQKQYESVYTQRQATFEENCHQVLAQLHFVDNQNVFYKAIADDAALFTFLTADIKTLQTVATLQLDDALAKQVLLDSLETNITLTSNGSLLDITFDIAGINPIEVNAILQSIDENQVFHTLQSGQLLSLDTPAFDKVHAVLADLREGAKFNGNRLSVNRLKGYGLADVLGETAQFDDTVKKLIYDLKYPNKLSFSVPKTLQTTLKPYQEEGFKWLKMLAVHQLGGILADDMGLGKTIQTIAYLLSEVEERHNQDKPFLIIAPASLVYNWQHELHKFAPSLAVRVVVGSKQERQAILADVQANQVLITSYQTFRQDSKLYTQQFHTVVLDEAQVVKNSFTKVYKRLKELSSEVMFALSGTPVENRKEDFWSIFTLILPGLFPQLTAYKKMAVSEIAKIAKPFILRRLKQDVLTELPDKLEKSMYSSLSHEQKTLYLAYLEKMQAVVSQYSAAELKQHRIDILAGLTRLRQICCHPRLFMPDYTDSSGKLEQFLDLVNQAVAGKHRILVFSQFASMLTILQETLEKNGYDVFLLNGKTPTKERMDLVTRFNNGEKDIFLISLKAGGTGLNLTGADTVILYDLWWNPAVEEQATGRAHRIGQSKKVQVYRLIAEGTIEEKIEQLQQSKKDLFDALVTDENNADLHRQNLSDDDIRTILGLQ